MRWRSMLLCILVQDVFHKGWPFTACEHTSSGPMNDTYYHFWTSGLQHRHKIQQRTISNSSCVGYSDLAPDPVRKMNFVQNPSFIKDGVIDSDSQSFYINDIHSERIELLPPVKVDPSSDSNLSVWLLWKRRKRKTTRHGRQRYFQNAALDLWIDRDQVRMLSGYMMDIYIIEEGRLLPHLVSPNFDRDLPVIPPEVEQVNFTWQSGDQQYFYRFNLSPSSDAAILSSPIVSVKPKGRVPKRPKVFSIRIPCAGNVSGIAAFGIGLTIKDKKGNPLQGMPLKFHLRKLCEVTAGPDPNCSKRCANGGTCDKDKRCRCKPGYMGQFCNMSLCYPRCQNGGMCSAPGQCTCPLGYHGRHCEGGICEKQCLNRGKCIQKDTCKCPSGFYGNRCEFIFVLLAGKCIIPCINGGRCRGVNKCRCKSGFSGDHCEVITVQGMSHTYARCLSRCRHGTCLRDATCQCKDAFTGKWCRRRSKKKSGEAQQREKLV